MTLRIKFGKADKNGNEKSAKTFVSKSTGASYSVTLNRNEVTYKITNLTSRRVYSGGEGISNTEVLQRHIRKKLKALGVEVEKEVRNIKELK